MRSPNPRENIYERDGGEGEYFEIIVISYQSLDKDSSFTKQGEAAGATVLILSSSPQNVPRNFFLTTFPPPESSNKERHVWGLDARGRAIAFNQLDEASSRAVPPSPLAKDQPMRAPLF